MQMVKEGQTLLECLQQHHSCLGFLKTLDGNGNLQMPVADMDFVSICQHSGLKSSKNMP